MMFRISKPRVPFLLIAILLTIACQEGTNEKAKDTTNQTVNVEQEKAAILVTINGETKAAFSRDYEGWRETWIHEPFVTKTYLHIADSSLSETLGWDKIDEFVKTYIAEHPEPDPLPTLVDDINVRLYGKRCLGQFSTE